MRRVTRSLIVWALAAVTVLLAPGVAQGQATNSQTGENNGSTDQGGGGESGDAVAGQVLGGVNSGVASVDARNRSVDVDAESGEAAGANTKSSFTGLRAERRAAGSGAQASSVTNTQTGDNDSAVDQSADAS